MSPHLPDCTSIGDVLPAHDFPSVELGPSETVAEVWTCIGLVGRYKRDVDPLSKPRTVSI